MKIKPITLFAAICLVLSMIWNVGTMFLTGLGIEMAARYAFGMLLHDGPLALFLFVLWSRQKDEA